MVRFLVVASILLTLANTYTFSSTLGEFKGRFKSPMNLILLMELDIRDPENHFQK